MGLLPFEEKDREVYVRKEAETSPKYGKDPNTRTVEELLQYGVVNIDKPAGPTSHQVSSYVKGILRLSKTGHSGTLDPNVTGVLVVTLPKATKIVETLLKAGKEYVCLMHVHQPVEEYQLRKVISQFIGKINQLPPVKSAVKRDWRVRKIYYIEINEVHGQDVLFTVGCQAGTYIRKLVHDMGLALGGGAHMVELRRTKAGPFNEKTITTLQDLQDAFHYYKEDGNEKFIRNLIQPLESAMVHLPRIWVFDTTVDTLCHGASLAVPGISKVESGIEPGDLVGIFTLKGELICYGEAKMTTNDMLGEKGLAVVTSKVVMEPGTYPRLMVVKNDDEKKDTASD